ncbi:NmrA family protein [Coprinopsis sp. MPI-PUGE-AT-0042]|nr:NmrA family protein [Coprinopsis sp. MPI-PUGE-AT-0042]
MTTVITGGGSKVGTHLGLLLKASGREAIFASRSGNRIPEGFGSVKLDWKDPATFENVLNTNPQFIYIVGDPSNPESYKDIVPFIEAAVKKGGVKKFVYLSATTYVDELGIAQLPRYFKENHIDHVILRPTWFTDNLNGYLIGALAKGQFETTVPTGRVPFVATEDIARGALKAITDDIINKDLVVLGPELLTYDEYAKIASEVLGRTITHRAVSPEELLQVKGSWAKYLIDLEVDIEKDGTEERWFNLSAEEAEKEGVEVFKGKVTVREWVEKNKADLK